MPVMWGARVQNSVPASLLLTLMAIALVALLSGCQEEASPEGGKVTLWITEDYGHHVIYAEAVELEAGQSVLSLLRQHVKVETSYGGRFVSGVAERSGDQERDWFYSVNGITADVGAHAYQPSSGDVIWWDYRPWGGDSPITPVAVGAWPEPFVNGYQGAGLPAHILYGDGFRELAEHLTGYLKRSGAEDIRIKPYALEQVQNRNGPTLVIALWPELVDSDFWQGIDQNWSRTGWLVRHGEEAFYPLNMDATHSRQGYGGEVASVVATGAGLGDDRALWLITALEPSGLAQAIEVLTAKPSLIERSFGLLVIEGDIIRLPVR